MHEIRCPSCQLRLWLYQGMGREVPLECPGCHVSRPIDRTDATAAARLGARIASDRRAGIMARQRAGDIGGDRPWARGATP